MNDTQRFIGDIQSQQQAWDERFGELNRVQAELLSGSREAIARSRDLLHRSSRQGGAQAQGLVVYIVYRKQSAVEGSGAPTLGALECIGGHRTAEAANLAIIDALSGFKANGFERDRDRVIHWGENDGGPRVYYWVEPAESAPTIAPLE
jgi:hypothetical protein